MNEMMNELMSWINIKISQLNRVFYYTIYQLQANYKSWISTYSLTALGLRRLLATAYSWKVRNLLTEDAIQIALIKIADSWKVRNIVRPTDDAIQIAPIKIWIAKSTFL